MPSSCRENTIIIIPAITLNVSEFWRSVWPKIEAEAPKITNTVEKPKQNKINGKKFVFFEFKISCKDWPDIYEMYPGINGNTHGDKKLIKPAPNAIKNSVINQCFS